MFLSFISTYDDICVYMCIYIYIHMLHTYVTYAYCVLCKSVFDGFITHVTADKMNKESMVSRANHCFFFICVNAWILDDSGPVEC